MKKIVLTFGLISGFIVAGLVWLLTSIVERGVISWERSELLGYTIMIVGLSAIFFGIKSYRDNYSGGKITFWKGVQIGVLISLIAGVLYFAGAWSYNLANPGFQARVMQKLSDETVGKLKAQGASQDQIDKATAEVDMMQKLFQNPALFFLICMVEILPVGIVLTLISAGLLRRKELLPATP